MASKGIGPLAQLRRAIIAGSEIEMDDSCIIIDSKIRLDKATDTEFHSMRGRGTAYALATLYLQFTHHDKPYTDYYKACDKAKTGHVLPIDKRDVVSYLRGAINTSQNIEHAKSEQNKTNSINTRFTPVSKCVEQRSAIQPNEDGAKAEKQCIKGDKQTEKEKATFLQHRSRVRDQRSLDSIMIVKDLDFSALREKLSQHVSDSKSGKINEGEMENRSESAPAYDPRGDRYTSNEDRFWRENMGSDFQDLGIDMSGSFKDKPSKSGRTGGRSENADVKKRRNNETSKMRTENEVNATKRAKRNSSNEVPIIVVPVGFNNLVCHGNVIEFLQNGRYTSTETLTKMNIAPVGKGREELIRMPGGNCSKAKYYIVSNPNRLSSEEWDNVVAVVCSGQEWQFKKWPIYDGGMKELFRKVHAVHFHFDDRAPGGKAESWPIKKIAISRSRRHNDHQGSRQFWTSLDDFLRKGKGKYLRY